MIRRNLLLSKDERGMCGEKYQEFKMIRQKKWSTVINNVMNKTTKLFHLRWPN